MLRVVLWALAGLAMVGGIILIRDWMRIRTAVHIPISRLDFSLLKDGIYVGEYDGGRLSNKVGVTVESGRVVRVDILKEGFYMGDLQRQVIGRVLDSQSLQIDTVSGATASTKATLKAIENALLETGR